MLDPQQVTVPAYHGDGPAPSTQWAARACRQRGGRCPPSDVRERGARAEELNGTLSSVEPLWADQQVRMNRVAAIVRATLLRADCGDLSLPESHTQVQ